jgi:geranylgeranylglycerol-phosphate geranylgeranyltransferase
LVNHKEEEKVIKGFYKLSRPLSSFTGALAVVLGGYVAGTGAWIKITLAALATILISAAANAWNDFRDIEIDKINQPKRPLPAGLVAPRAAWIFAIVMALISLLLVSFINMTAFIIAVVSVILLYIYSLRLKSTVLLGNITVAAISALSAIFGGIAAGNPRPSLWLAAVIIVGIFGREVLKTLADYEGDLRQQCRTVATVWGRRAARIVFFVLVGATLVVMMVPYLADVYHPVYAYIVAIGVYPVVIYVTIRVTKERSGIQLEKLSQLMKYDFLVWFLAVLLGAA